MRAFVTGGSGFLGGAILRQLLERGDDVVALARSHEAAARLTDAGATPFLADLTDEPALRLGMEGADLVVHAGGVYAVGIRDSERPAMYAANVTGTKAALDAAGAAGVPRIAYVSTANVFGNTNGQIVDETYRRPAGPCLSYYDRTKYIAHQVALDRIREGLPVIIAQLTGIYGPGDHSESGGQLAQAMRGELPVLALSTVGLSLVYVDDAARGVLLVADKGRLGESYVIGGEATTLGQAVERIAALAGVRPPRVVVPNWAVKAAAPLGPLLAPLGYPPNLRETVRAADGVTYWASSEKARKELGYSWRSLDEGLRDLIAASRQVT